MRLQYYKKRWDGCQGEGENEMISQPRVMSTVVSNPDENLPETDILGH